MKNHISAMCVTVYLTSTVVMIWFMLIFWEANTANATKRRNEATGVYEYTYKSNWKNEIHGGTVACVSMIAISASVHIGFITHTRRKKSNKKYYNSYDKAGKI